MNKAKNKIARNIQIINEVVNNAKIKLSDKDNKFNNIEQLKDSLEDLIEFLDKVKNIFEDLGEENDLDDCLEDLSVCREMLAAKEKELDKRKKNEIKLDAKLELLIDALNKIYFYYMQELIMNKNDELEIFKNNLNLILDLFERLKNEKINNDNKINYLNCELHELQNDNNRLESKNKEMRDLILELKEFIENEDNVDYYISKGIISKEDYIGNVDDNIRKKISDSNQGISINLPIQNVRDYRDQISLGNKISPIPSPLPAVNYF